MQALLGSYRWDWEDLRGQLPGPAAAWIPDTGGDLIGPGIAIDETAHIKHGDATACVAPQHAGCTGQVENCVTIVFSAYVTANGQAWADFDVYMPDRRARDMPRRRAAGIPGDLQFATKPQLADRQLGRLLAAGLPARWVAFDEVYGRSEELRKKAARAGLSYVAIIPCDHPVPLPSGAVIRVVVGDRHAVAAAQAAAQQPGQQRLPVPGSARGLRGLLVGGQPGEVRAVLVLGDVGGKPARQHDQPLAGGLHHFSGVRAAGDLPAGIDLTAAVGVIARVSRVAQHVLQRLPGRAPPFQVALRRPRARGPEAGSRARRDSAARR